MKKINYKLPRNHIQVDLGYIADIISRRIDGNHREAALRFASAKNMTALDRLKLEREVKKKKLILNHYEDNRGK